METMSYTISNLPTELGSSLIVATLGCVRTYIWLPVSATVQRPAVIRIQ